MPPYPVLDRLLRIFRIAGVVGVAALLLGAGLIVTVPRSNAAAAGGALVGVGICLSYAWYRAQRAYRREVARLDAQRASKG